LSGSHYTPAWQLFQHRKDRGTKGFAKPAGKSGMLNTPVFLYLSLIPVFKILSSHTLLLYIMVLVLILRLNGVRDGIEFLLLFFLVHFLILFLAHDYLQSFQYKFIGCINSIGSFPRFMYASYAKAGHTSSNMTRILSLHRS